MLNEAEGQPEQQQGQEVEKLYAPKEEAGMQNLPNRGIQSMTEDVIRTHGAARIDDQIFMIGYGVCAAFLIVAIGLIAFGKGPRKRHALGHILQQKAAQKKA